MFSVRRSRPNTCEAVYEGPSEAVCSVHLSFSLSGGTVQTCSVFIIPAGRSVPGAGGSTFRPFDEGDNPFPCRRETPGVRDREHSNPYISAPQPGRVRVRGEPQCCSLAVDGGTVCFGFPRGVDYPHEAVSELLQDQPLCLHLRLMSLFCLLGLFQQTLARRFKHLLCYERVWQPVGRRENKSSERENNILHVSSDCSII